MPYIAKEYRRYQFSSGARVLRGEKPDFLAFLRTLLQPNARVLDLGCGSGELALTISARCHRIDGIDISWEYIKTAKVDKAKKKIKNAYFQIANAEELPYRDETFDLVYSSRGPLSAGPKFMKESMRVLKVGGWLAEETIGEQDKVELKKIFGRGQNYPVRKTKLSSVKMLLKKYHLELMSARYYLYYQIFSSWHDVLKILLRAPIIPNFSEQKDAKFIEVIKKRDRGQGFILRAHRLLWAAQKK